MGELLRRSPDFPSGYYKGEGLHPYTCSNTTNQNLMGLIYEPLFAIDKTSATEPCLAKSCTIQVTSASGSEEEKDTEGDAAETDTEGDETDQKDASKEEKKKEQPRSKIAGKTTCTIQLRDDVTFSDGTSLSAEDVVYSLEQAKGKGSIYRERLSDVTTLTASGSTTVVIEINAADAAFDSLLDIPIISRSGGSNPIGTGPYVLNTKKGKAVSMTRNTNWWQEGTLPADTITLYAADDSDVAIVRLRQRQHQGGEHRLDRHQRSELHRRLQRGGLPHHQYALCGLQHPLWPLPEPVLPTGAVLCL